MLVEIKKGQLLINSCPFFNISNMCVIAWNNGIS